MHRWCFLRGLRRDCCAVMVAHRFADSTRVLVHTETTLCRARSSRITGWDMQDDALRKALGGRIKTRRKDKHWVIDAMALKHQTRQMVYGPSS